MDGDALQETLLVDQEDAKCLVAGQGSISLAASEGVASLLFGSCGGLVRQAFPGRHLEA